MSHPIHSTLSQQQTLALGNYPDVTVIRENNAFLMLKSRATAQTGDIATFRFNSYGSNKLLLKLQSHPILGDEDHANYVHATDAIVKVGAVGSANNATSIQINTNDATQYIEVRNAVHGNASNPLRLKLTKTAERDDDFSGETEFEFTLAFVAPAADGITGDTSYKLSADVNAANERFGLFSIILTATDSGDNNAQTANVVGRIGMVPHVSIFKLTAAAAASTSVNGADDFSGTVDRAFTVTADGHSSDKFYNSAKIEAALDWATTASFSSAQTTGGIFSVRHAAPTLTDANGALKVRAEVQAYPAGATVSDANGVTTYTFANIAAATALAGAAQFGRLIGAQLYDGNTAKANAFVIHKNVNGTTVTIVVSGTGHDTATPTFQLTALAGQQNGNITSSSITLRAFKGAPDAINNLAGTLPTIKNALGVVSSMQENNGSVASTDNGVLTVTTPSFLNLSGGSVAAVESKISASTNQLILSTKALADAGATFALNEGRTSCVITLPVAERDITSLIQNGQDADIVDNADTPAVSGTCTSANITLATADDAATGGKTITITAANGATIPAEIGTGSFAIMGADATDAASLSRAAFANLDAKFAKLQSADESGAKTNVYLNTNQLNKHAGSLVISGSTLTGTALKVGSLSNTRGRDVTVTVDREAAFTTAGGRSVTTMDVSANHGIAADDILSQVGNAVKATVDSVSSNTLTLKADYEGHFDTSADVTKYDSNDQKYYLFHDQDITLPETGSDHIDVGHIILDKNGIQGTVKTKHTAAGGNRKFTLEKSTGLFATGQTPLKAGAAGSEKTLQTNEFKYTTLAATANPADGNAVLQAGTVTAATLNVTNLAHEDNGDGTKTHTINVDVSTYEDGVSAFNSTGLLTVHGKALKYQEVKLSGNGTASSATNANQTVSGKHIKINDTLTGIGAVKAIKVKLTLGATITTAITKGETITQHNSQTVGTSTAAHDANALTAGSQLEVLVTTDTKPFDATGDDITVGGTNIAVTAVETTLLVDNTTGDLAANDNPKVAGKISGSAGTIQLQEITLNNQYTIAGQVGETIALAAVGGNAAATGTIKKVTVDGDNTKYLIEAANGGTDFATGVNATVNNIANKYQRLTVDADIKTHLGDLPTANSIVQKTGNADAGSATVTASDNTNKYIYASNNGAAAFVASTNKTDLTVNQDEWAQEVKTAGDNIVLSAFGDGDVVQGMYVTGSGIKPNTIVASADHANNTITLDKASTLDHSQALHFHDDTIKLDGASHPTGFIELDISALVTSHGFILPPTDSVVSQGNVTGTVQGSSANGKIILKTSGNGAASDAFTTATGLSVNIADAGAKEQNFQKVTVSADNSALGKLSDLSAVATINDTTASVITQLDTSGNEVARGYLRALSGAVATVQVESGTFVTTNTHALHYGGNTHRYVSLTLPTAAILATEKNADGLLQNGNVLTDGTHSGVIRSSSINGSDTVAVVEYTTNQAAGNITGGNLTINGKFQATQTITVTTNEDIFGDDILPNADTVITQGNASGTVISKNGQVLTVRLDDTNTFANNLPLTYNSIVHNRVVLTLSAALSTDTDLNTGGGFAANAQKWVFQVGTNATGQTLLDESGTTLTLINVTGTFNDSGELRYADTKNGAANGTKLAVDAVTSATASLNFQNAGSWGGNMTKAKAQFTVNAAGVNNQNYVITLNDGANVATTITPAGDNSNSASNFAGVIRAALGDNGNVTAKYTISGADDNVIIEAKTMTSDFTVATDANVFAGDATATSTAASTNSYTMTAYEAGSTQSITLQVGTATQAFTISRAGQGASGSTTEAALATAVETHFQANKGGAITSAAVNGQNNAKVDFTNTTGANFTITVTDVGSDAVAEDTATTTNGIPTDTTLLLPNGAGTSTDFVDAVSASTVLAASANTQVLQSPSAATTNPGLKPAVSGKYYSLSAVQAATQVQPSAVTIGQLTASTVTNHNATPLNSNGSAYSGSNATLDFEGAGAPVSGQTRRTVSSVLSPSFKVTPAVVGKLANTGTGFTDNSSAPVTATYTAASTSQELAFQFGHGSYTEQIAAFRFRVTVTCDGSSEKFNVTVHTFSTPSLYFSKYLKTTQKSFVDDATNYEDATISATTGNVQVGGSDSNSGSGTVSSKWQVFREDDAATFFQNIIGTTPGFAQVNSRLGGGISDYLPILESETLVVASKSGQGVFFKHKSTYDLFDLAGTPAAYPVSDDIAKLITSRNLAADSNDTIRIGNADYSLQSATAAVEAVSGIKQLKITFKGGLDIAAIAADQALNLKLAGANTKHNRFDLLTSGDGAVSNTSVGPFKVRAVAANWASSEASAGEAYSEKVLLVYHDDTDDKSYVVSSVEVGLQVANTDDGSNFQIKSNMNGETIKVFREDIIAYPSTTDGLPIIFASATGGDDAYTFSLAVTGVVSETTSNGNMNKPANRVIQGSALADQLFVSTGDVTSYNYSSGVDPIRILTASINLRDHSSSVGTSDDAETFAVTYQPTQTFNTLSGFTSQAGATIGSALTTNVTVLNTTGSISGFSAGGIHAWDRGIGNNVDLASVNIAAAVAITFDSKGLALKVHLVNEGGQNKLKMTTTGTWNGIDNAAVGAGKSTRNVTYGLQGNEANYYRLADRFITGHATGTDGGAASNRYFMTTTGMTAGKALKGYLEYQTNEASTTANGAVTGDTTKIVMVTDKTGIEVGDSLLPANVIVRGTVNNAAATIVASLTVQSINGGNNEITLTSADDRFTGVQIANGADLTFRETHTVTVGMVTNVFTHACSGTDTENTLNLDTENTNVVPGMVVSGTGIREGTTVVSKTILALTLTNAAGAALTADITNGSITFRADGYVYQANGGTIESATLVNNGIREGGKFTVVTGTGEGNAIPGRAFASNAIDVHVYRDTSFRLEDTTTSDATRTNVVSSNLTGTGNSGQNVVAMSSKTGLVVGQIVGPTIDGTANTASYINPIPDDTTITNIDSGNNNITLSNNLAATINGAALTFYSVPQRTIHGSVSASTDTKLVRYRTATADGKTGIGAAGNVTKISVVGSGLHDDAQGTQTAVTIADGGNGVNGSLISLKGDKIFANAPTDYTSEVTIKVQDVNAEAVAQIGGTGIPFGAGVAQHTQQFKLKVIPDPVLAVKTNAVATLNVFDKLLVHQADIFKVKMNYFADSFNKASMTLNNGATGTVNATKTDIAGTGTLDLLKSGADGVAVVKATIPAPNAVHTDLNFLKLNIDGTNGYVAGTHQVLGTEMTYTSTLSDVSKAGAGDANYTLITGNVLLTSKTTAAFLAKLTRHHNPQILQNAKKGGDAIANVNGQRFTHSATTQTHKASWKFTEFTGRTLGGNGAATGNPYHNIYTLEKARDGAGQDDYAHDDAIITTNHSNGLYPNMQLTSNTSSDSGNFQTVKITDQPKFASSIADGATIPTNLTDDETYLKATFKFTSNDLAGEGTESITYTFTDKLTTKAHPHIRFNHRTSGANDSTIQSETENAVNAGKTGNLPWLVYTAENLASNAPFADWTVAGDTAATTSIQGDTTGKNVSIVTNQTKLQVGTATAYAEADAFKHVFLRRALAGYDGPKGLAQDADGIRLTISAKPVLTVLNRENEASPKYLGLTSASVNALRDGIKTGDKVHPVGNTIGSDPTQAQFDVGNADGAAGKSDVTLTFANGLASFKAVGHSGTANYPGFNFSDSYAIAKDSSNTHFDGSKGSVGFLRVNSGALSIEADTTNIPTQFTNGSGLSGELVAAGTQNLKRVARANDGGFSLSTSGQTVADIDAGGHAFVVQGGRRKTGGAVVVTAQGDNYSMNATLNGLQFADTGATLVVPPRLAYKSTSTPTTSATDTFDITYTQLGSKLLSTDTGGSNQGFTTITSAATTLTFNVLKNLNETIHIADNITASTWVSNNNANTGLALSGTTLTDATERNYYYAQTLTPSGNADEKLLAVYFNRVEDLAAITDGSARVANKQHGNLHSITKDDGTVNETNSGYFHVETTSNREAFGIYLHNTTQEGNFKGSTGTQEDLTMKLKPNGYSAGELTLDITKLNAVKAPMTESLKNTTALGDVSNVSGGVVVYDAAASEWQTVVPDSTSTNTTSDAPANVWAGYGDGSTGTGSTYNAVTGTETFNSKTSPLWSMATLDPTGAQTALSASNVAFSSTTAAHSVAGEQWASLAGGVQAGANGATNASSANALFQRYYADADKVKTLTHPNWVGDGARHKLDPTATVTGAFRIPLENTGNSGTYNVADNATTTDKSTRGTNTDATNTVTLSRQANTYNANVVVKMSSPQKFSLSSKPSFVRHADDANLGAVTNRTRSKIMESMSTYTTTALAHFGPEDGGVLGNRVVCFTDLNDLRDALVANGKRQLSDRENRFELDSTPTALAKTSTVVGVARYADATPARRFQLEEQNNKATLSVVLSGADAFYKQNVSCVMVLDTLGESPNDIRVGDFVYQSGLTYSKGVAPNNKQYEQTFGRVILVSSNPPTIKVEFAGLEVNDLHNKAIMDENFATQVNSTNPGARRGWSQPGYQKADDKTDGETHGDGSSVTHIPFIVSGGVAGKKLTLIRGYNEATNTTSNANVKAFQSFDVSSVVVSTSNLTRRLSVNSAMVGRLGSGKTYAIYAQTTGSTEGEQFVDLKITTTGGDSFVISENSVDDKVNGVYSDDRYGDVEISDNFQIGKFGSVDHSAAAQGGFQVTHDSGDNYTFRLGGTANNTWSTVSQVTTGTGTIADNALTTLTLTTTNTFIKKDMVVHGHANLQTDTLVSNVVISGGVSVVTLSKAATNGGFNGQAVKFSNDLDSKLLQSADLTVLHTSFVVRENAEGDTVFIWRINNTPAPTSTQFSAKLIGGINQVTGTTLGPNVLALGGGTGSANQVTAKSMRSEQNVELLPFYVIQTITPTLSTSYPHSTLPETPYTREVVFNSVVDANQSFQMDMTAGNTTTSAQAQWGNGSTIITLAGADVADLRFGDTETKTRTVSLTNGSPTITLLGHVEATTTGASTNTTVPVAATGLANGMKVVGTGITNGTTITVNGNTVTASQAINVSSGQKLFFTRSTDADEEAKLVAVDNFSAAASTITLSAADATIITGTSVSGPGIASGTVVTAINSNTLTLSNATTADGGGNLIFERSVFIGMTATLPGNIPAKAYVTAVSGNSITLSANAGATATAQVAFSNIGPGAYVTTETGSGIQADTHVVEYNGATTVTVNQNTSAAQGTDTAISFKIDSQYDNIVAVSGGTSFTPESYIYRLDRHLKTYKLTYVQSTVSAFGKLTLHTEQGETSSDRTTDKPTKDSHGINLVNNRRYLIVAVDYADRVVDGNPTVTTTYNGYYKYDSGNDVFLYDNASGVSGSKFGMDTGRVEPTASTSIGPYRIAIIPSGDATTYNAYKGGHSGNQAMANIGGLFSTSSSVLPNDDMREIKTNGSTKPTFQRMTQLIRNEGAQYTRGSTNGFPYYRIQDVPSRLDHSDLVIILLRADANTSANNLTLKYDRIMNGDSIQAYQLRGAVDYSGMSSDIEWSGNPVVGTTTKMPLFYQNTGTELNPLASQIELSLVNPSPLAAADTAIFSRQDLRSHQFLHSSNSGTSLRYSRKNAPMAPTGADSTTNFTTYDSTKKVFQFRAANSLTLEETESLPLFD